jgi:hypothetical protein
MITKRFLYVGLGLTIVASIALYSQTAAAPQQIIVISDTNIGGGNHIGAGFDSNHYTLVSATFWAQQGWVLRNQDQFKECQPVPAGQPIKACPDPVSQVGMDGQEDHTAADGTRVISVNTQCAVAGCQYTSRIKLVIVPKT